MCVNELSGTDRKLKVVVTGASGFLARRFVYSYKNVYEIYAPTHAEMDLVSEESCRLYIEEVQPDVVLHCAAVSNTNACEEHPDETRKVNVDGVKYIATACKNVGAKMIFASSDQVYNGNGLEELGKETDVLVPKSVYGNQKLEAEELVLSMVEGVCLRLPWMCDKSREEFPDHADFYSNLLRAIENKQTLRFADCDKRGIAAVQDVVENLPKTFELPSGAYNFGAKSNYSSYVLATNVVKRLFPNNIEALQCIGVNENITKKNARNLAMDMSKVEVYGIEFIDSVESIVRLHNL